MVTSIQIRSVSLDATYLTLAQLTCTLLSPCSIAHDSLQNKRKKAQVDSGKAAKKLKEFKF